MALKAAEDYLTVRIASLLVTLPASLATTTEKRAPLSAAVTGGVIKDEPVPPAIFRPFFLHWWLKGAVPLAMMVNFAVFSGLTALSAG